MQHHTHYLRHLLVSALIPMLVACGSSSNSASNEDTQNDSATTIPAGTSLTVRLMETTDLHANMMNYNYFTAKQDDKVGLVKTAALIRTARNEVDNSILVDNGDLIQGAALGDYMSQSRRAEILSGSITHPIFAAMNTLDYDVANIGNHEFNFGLAFLQAAIKGAEFPYISANVFIDDGDDNPDNDQPVFQPYLIQEKQFKDDTGTMRTIKIGYIGFVPPQIMTWDKSNLEGKVIAKDISAMAKKYVPEMRQKGAELVIAIPHSGISISAPKGKDEQSSYYLSKVAGIDAILFGHSHANFPGDRYDTPALKAAGIDAVKGTINDVPSVMPGFWGDHLGIIDLSLTHNGSAWQVTHADVNLRPIYTRKEKQVISQVENDPQVKSAVASAHEATIQWVGQPIAKIASDINSFFALVQDDPSIQVVNDAQIWYTKKVIEGDVNLQHLPVLSAAAPFRAGYGGHENYTNVPAGDIAFRNIADLYLYPNTLKVVKLTGAEVKEWLEKSAGQFNTINPTDTSPQALVNNHFPTYNFDVIDGVSYEIDVTVPPRYIGRDSVLANPQSHRISNLRFQGKLIDPDQVFLVATNNYRASGGGSFPGVTADKIVIDAPDENRKVIADYLIAKTLEQPETGFDPSQDNNWHFKNIPEAPSVFYYGSSLDEALQYADTLANVTQTDSTNDKGYTQYLIKLSH